MTQAITRAGINVVEGGVVKEGEKGEKEGRKSVARMNVWHWWW